MYYRDGTVWKRICQVRTTMTNGFLEWIGFRFGFSVAVSYVNPATLDNTDVTITTSLISDITSTPVVSVTTVDCSTLASGSSISYTVVVT